MKRYFPKKRSPPTILVLLNQVSHFHFSISHSLLKAKQCHIIYSVQ